MAQDFGDEVGDMLFRSVTRFATDAARDYLKEQMKKTVLDFHEQKLVAAGMSKDEARAAAEVMASKQHVCMPFGTDTDAAYFAKVCGVNDVAAFAFTDGNGKGYVLIAEDDLPKMKSCVGQFSEVMTLVKKQEISEMIDKTRAVPDDVLKKLKPIKEMPDLPRTENPRERARDDSTKNQAVSAAPIPDHKAVDYLSKDPFSHTAAIRDKILLARDQCRDLDDFKEILAKGDVGITIAANGEQKFYEARTGENGEIFDFDKDKDWSVKASTLRDNWKCDATLDWFEKNTPKEPTAPAHEAMPPQVDLNLICNAVRGDLEERGIRTLDRPDGKMGFLVDAKHKQEVIAAVEARFPGHTPDELGIEFDDGGRGNPPNPPAPQVADGSLDMDGRTPDFNQGIESHDGMDTATNTARMEREQSNTDVAPSVVRESSQPRLKEVEKEMRAASKQLSQTNDSPDRDISDKFQQER